ncbi:hypothetical protein EK904_005248 [Melospiza melodia maxima]|nr:hypothetical protein EK904_005248 [Melospiza melodia maxima]
MKASQGVFVVLLRVAPPECHVPGLKNDILLCKEDCHPHTSTYASREGRNHLQTSAGTAQECEEGLVACPVLPPLCQVQRRRQVEVSAHLPYAIVQVKRSPSALGREGDKCMCHVSQRKIIIINPMVFKDMNSAVFI